ncbi:MAG: peroxiredoxin [Flavobacteriaceae bacterium]|nr:peroxiredoxin [Flavobacteriaceae bacterium]
MNTIRLGDEAPNFIAVSTEGKINFHKWLGDSWGILFSHPADYTPVCTTELGMVAKYKDEFERRNVKVIGLSIDSLESHLDWIKDINETQNVTVNFPIIADNDKSISELYDMIHINEHINNTVRSLFIIDPSKKIRLIITYPASTGRNFDEIIRTIDSLQLTEYHRVATPANWKNGDDCLIMPSVTNKEIEELFPKGHTTIKKYFKKTPQPNIS